MPAFEAVGRRIDPSQWYPAAVWAVFRSNQWSTTGLSKAVVCTVLSVYGKVHIKDPLLLIEKSSLCGGSGFPSNKCVNVTI